MRDWSISQVFIKMKKCTSVGSLANPGSVSGIALKMAIADGVRSIRNSGQITAAIIRSPGGLPIPEFLPQLLNYARMLLGREFIGYLARQLVSRLSPGAFETSNATVASGI